MAADVAKRESRGDAELVKRTWHLRCRHGSGKPEAL